MNRFFVLALVAAAGVAWFSVPSYANGQEDKGPIGKITFIHRKKHALPVKPDGAGKQTSPACYGYLAKGAKWKTTENYVVNPTNSYKLTESQVVSALKAGVDEWEEHGGTHLFGSGSTDAGIAYDGDVYDGKNSVSFGIYPDSGVIGVTTVWGYFGGNPATRELVEWDMQLNELFAWGTDGSEDVMDLANIATHELGHSAGMADLYTAACNQETMYGYSDEGDVIKRTLNTGDIAGIRALYSY